MHHRYGARVTGIDLTPEYIDVARDLCRMVGVEDRVSLHQGSAVDMPFATASFSGAYMLHVGMNIGDKNRLFAEAARVLRPGSLFGIYDVMRTGAGELAYPVPWATDPACSAVESPEHYRTALHASDFQILSERNRREFALAYFHEQKAATSNSPGPPPLSLHTLMGPRRKDQVRNMVVNISSGTIAPVELIVRRT
jgi:ubiquinone/menaquinone biosynthesis C-methylase UbiE